MEKKHVAVLAGNYGQYAEYHGNEKDGEEYQYIDRPQKLYGRDFTRVDVIGTFWERNDASALYEEVKRRFPHLIA